nr:HAMP domain-containing sensor histidine kinase [uncultured Holophaga sp.]
MSETQIVLIFFLATLALVVLCWLALFSLVHARGRIIRAQKAALEAERRLRIKHDAFSRNAHHELRTPLQVILGNLEMLGMMDPAPQQAAIIAQARAGTQRLTSLVQNLLDLAAVADGTLRLSPVLGDLDMRIACLQGRFREAARAKGLAFEADCPMIGLLFHCDAARIEQIMSHLLDNAIKFTAQGQVRFQVGISALPERPGWQLLEIEVEDTGIGLPEDWERMLVPFEHSERSHAAARGGLGIGLPMVAGLVRLMGGSLDFERLPQGTRARVGLVLEAGETTVDGLTE